MSIVDCDGVPADCKTISRPVDSELFATIGCAIGAVLMIRRLVGLTGGAIWKAVARDQGAAFP